MSSIQLNAPKTVGQSPEELRKRGRTSLRAVHFSPGSWVMCWWLPFAWTGESCKASRRPKERI